MRSNKQRRLDVNRVVRMNRRELGAGGRTESYTYDSNGNLTEFGDALGNVTTWTYDDRGLVETVKAPRGR